MFATAGVSLMVAWVMATASGADVPPWAQYGILGLLVLAFATRQIVPGTTWREEKARGDAYETETKTTFTPTLIHATETLNAVLSLLTEFKQDRDTQIGQLTETLNKAVAVIEANHRAQRAGARKTGKKV